MCCSQLETLEYIERALTGSGLPRTWADCLCWARLLFERNFNNAIGQLLFNFPKEHVRYGCSHFNS